MSLTRGVDATPAERSTSLPGDELVAARVVLDRGFTLPAPPPEVWPWLVQIGKDRGGWYLPASVERFVPAGHRGVRRIVPGLQTLRAGDTIADWGGRSATLTLVAAEPPRLLLHRSQRGRTTVTWALALSPVADGTRVHSRVRIGPVRRVRLAEALGGAFDELTILGLAAGLRERLAGPAE